MGEAVAVGQRSWREQIRRHRHRLLLLGILAIAVAVRVALFGSHPGGLNQDEASVGYDAWALLHYGVDRNGFSFPVHLMAWGSGQNALYAYLSMPFIALLGLSEVSVRLVNLLFGLAGVVAVYGAMKRLCGRRAALAATALAAISPWHIMLSRWGLESNLFPGMLMLSLWALAASLDRPPLLVLSGGLFALSLYAYGSAYLVVSLLFGVCLLYLWLRRPVPRRWCVIAAAVYAAVGLPIYLFVLVNLFHLGDLMIGPFSIPQLYGDRMVSVLDGLSPGVVVSNLRQMLLLQDDGATRNGFSGYGCVYLISMPFWMWGLVRIFRDKRPEAFFLRAFFLCPLSLFLVYAQPNINRVNAVYFPLILLAGLGLADLCRKREVAVTVALAYALLFGGFCTRYFGRSYREEIADEFFASLGDAIVCAEEMAGETDTVYVTDLVGEPYIYVLFYTRPSPLEYRSTAEIPFPEDQFQWVYSFGRYEFYTGDVLYRPGVYVLDNRELEPELYAYKLVEFRRYSVVVVDDPPYGDGGWE